MAIQVHSPNGGKNFCESCGDGTTQATSVINGVSQCNRCAGQRIIGEYPEILGAILADKLTLQPWEIK
jgi:hypothetical protein